jgi:hypothetical protein
VFNLSKGGKMLLGGCFGVHLSRRWCSRLPDRIEDRPLDLALLVLLRTHGDIVAKLCLFLLTTRAIGFTIVVGNDAENTSQTEKKKTVLGASFQLLCAVRGARGGVFLCGLGDLAR